MSNKKEKLFNFGTSFQEQFAALIESPQIITTDELDERHWASIHFLKA